ncbi:uncharacterized protein N7484_005648 [Penicillium longicatenatum]|uniref:uncharacterized protein n=1 Tax=Penicillium longicatenatum TaxID=1561947 RepID=UPI0025482EA1|nr:uncharacterized protein N7484_005648 [Penicillium longicatenatum]KAJ5643141.1 hypothetical protein N7484_005648 [Penicillium longicatenatum]
MGHSEPDLGHFIAPSNGSDTGPKCPECPESWNDILMPYLRDTLAFHGCYTTEDMNRHLEFFSNHVTRWLGPGPSYNPDTGLAVMKYPSSLTNDHTPFEVSCCWKSKLQSGKPIVRYVTDVIPFHLEVSRMAGFKSAIEVIATLERVAKCPKGEFLLRAFPKLWSHITDKMIEYEQQTHSEPCKKCSPSGVFVGFDLVDSVSFAKLYWLFPACQKTPELVQGVRSMLASCVDHSPTNFPRLIQNWAKIENHFNSYPDILQPRMLSVDATKFPEPRVKVYARRIFSGTNDFSDIEPHLSLNGTIPLPGAFRDTCKGLWGSLIGAEDSQPGKGPKYCLLLYEIGTGSSSKSPAEEVSAKLYVMCQEIPRVDSFVAQCLYQNCDVLQDADLIKYELRLRELVRDDLNADT